MPDSNRSAGYVISNEFYSSVFLLIIFTQNIDCGLTVELSHSIRNRTNAFVLCMYLKQFSYDAPQILAL